MKKLTIKIVAILFSANLAHASVFLVGSDVTNDSLLSIDPASGVGTPIGPLGDDVVAGLGYDPNHNILYGTSTSTNALLKIDPETSQTTMIGPFGSNLILMHSVKYNPNNNVLYGITNQTSTRALYQINVNTGQASYVGAHNIQFLGGLAYDEIHGTMYAADLTNLYKLDLVTGSPTLIGSFNLPFVADYMTALAYHPDFGLFGCDNSGSPTGPAELFQINVSTGQATFVGNIANTNVLGLAFVPEPAFLFPLLAVITLLRRRLFSRQAA